MNGKPILRGSRDDLPTIAARHWPTIIEAETEDQVTVEICGRCEQLWPCDSSQLVGVLRAIGRGESDAR